MNCHESFQSKLVINYTGENKGIDCLIDKSNIYLQNITGHFGCFNLTSLQLPCSPVSHRTTGIFVATNCKPDMIMSSQERNVSSIQQIKSEREREIN